jgi:hypothetical protein
VGDHKDRRPKKLRVAHRDHGAGERASGEGGGGMPGFGRGRFEERPPPSWGMPVFASTGSAVSASVWKVACVAPASSRRRLLAAAAVGAALAVGAGAGRLAAVLLFGLIGHFTSPLLVLRGGPDRRARKRNLERNG